MSDKATPRPWHFERGLDNKGHHASTKEPICGSIMGGDEDWHIARVWSDLLPEMAEANGELIIAAVNSYDRRQQVETLARDIATCLSELDADVESIEYPLKVRFRVLIADADKLLRLLDAKGASDAE